MADLNALNISLVISMRACHSQEWCLQVPTGTTVHGLLTQHDFSEYPELDLTKLGVGIWGRKVAPSHVLRDLDRVEIYRPLTVDPKVARRERFKRQGVRKSGLFLNQN